MSYVLSAVRDEIEKNHQSWLQEGRQEGRQEVINLITKIMEAQDLDQKAIKEMIALSKKELEKQEI